MNTSSSRKQPPIWSPLCHTSFRRLYLVYLLSFAANSVIEASAAWELTRSGASPSLVAMVSTAATLPIVLFIVPFGALADSFDRRVLIGSSQIWSVLAALTLCAAAAFLAAPRWEYLVLVAVNGIAMAIRLPSITSMAGSRIDPQEVENAMTLLGLGTSLTRIVGPIAAGGVIAVYGAGYSFVGAALLSGIAFFLTMSLQRKKNRSESLPAERFLGAIRVAISFTRQSPEFRKLLLKGFTFFLVGSGAFALGPMALSKRFGETSAVFMYALAASGLGALIIGQVLPRLRARVNVQSLARIGALSLALAAFCLAVATSIWVGLLGALLNGMGWLIGHSIFTSRAQQILPGWVRARGMSVTHAIMISAVSAGSLLWGGTADLLGFEITFGLGAALALTAAALPGWSRLPDLPEKELNPKSYWSEPSLAVIPEEGEGPAVLQVRYNVDERKLGEFLEAAKAGRRLRLRSGALSWLLLRDLEEPNVFVEQIVFESWQDRQRHAGRTTEADALVRMRKLSALAGSDEFQSQHLLAVGVNDPK